MPTNIHDSDRPNKAQSGFTLIELLMVMAIIGVLAGMVFALGGNVYGRSEITRAKAQMELIAQALETYKSRYFDYPWNTDGDYSGITLSDALLGLRDPEGNLLTDEPMQIETLEFKDDGDFQIIIDPWGMPYIYMYSEPMNADESGGDWEYADYILISAGPDMLFDDTGIAYSGKMDYNNADNLVFGH